MSALNDIGMKGWYVGAILEDGNYNISVFDSFEKKKRPGKWL